MKKNLRVLILLTFLFSLPGVAQIQALKPAKPGSVHLPLPESSVGAAAKRTMRANPAAGVEFYRPDAKFECPQAIFLNPGIVLSATRLTPELVQLTWETQYLIDKTSFYVERSFNDTNHFKVIEFVPARSHMAMNESFTLKNRNQHMNLTFYRLRQSDGGSFFAHSNIVSVDGIRPFRLFPNPVVNKLNIQVATTQTGDATILIYDALGRARGAKTVILIKDVLNDQAVDVSDLTPGIYYTKICMADDTYQSAVFIKK